MSTQLPYLIGVYEEIVDETLEEQILTFIKEHGEIQPSKLIEELPSKLETSPSEIRAAIWRLIDRGKLELTPNRFIRPR